MKLDKVKVLKYTKWFFPYFFLLILALNILYNIEFLFVILISSLLLVIYLFLYIQNNKFMKKQIKELKFETETLRNKARSLKSLSPLVTPEIIVESLKEVIFSSKNEGSSNEPLIDFILEENKQIIEAIIKLFQKTFLEDILNSLEILLDFVDKEEYELIKFLSTKRKHNFLFWSIFQAIIICLSLIFGFLYAFMNIFLLSSFLYILLILLNKILKDVKNVVNKKFQNGLNRYHKNRKIFADYQINLNLVCNNYRLRSFESFKKIEPLLKSTNIKIDYYKNIIKPYYFYVQKYEIVGILGIIIGIVTVIIQAFLLQIQISLFYFGIINLVLYLLLFYNFIIMPIRDYKKSLKIEILETPEGKKLKENLNNFTTYQYIILKKLED